MDTKKLRQKILDLAIRGKLVPQDPNDEPASLLLERIRAEKERLIAEGKIKRPKKSKATSRESHYQQLPQGWTVTRLSDIAWFGGGKTPSTENKAYWENGTVNWITSKDMKEPVITDSKIKLSTLGASQNTLYPKGTLLMVTRSGILRRTLPLAVIGKESTVNQDIKTINTPFGEISEFLYWYFSALEKEILEKYQKDGTTVESVDFERFQDIEIFLPPLSEQKRIIDQLKTLLHLIDVMSSDSAQIKTTIEKAKSKILDLAMQGKIVPQDPADEPAADMLRRINPRAKIITDNPHSWNIPNNWCWTRVKDVFNPMEKAVPSDSEFFYIDIDSVDNRTNTVSPKQIKTEYAPSRASRKTQRGDIVFSMVRPYLRNVAVVPFDGCIASTGFYVLSRSSAIYPPFAFRLALSEFFVSGLNSYMKGDNSPSINKSDMEEFIIPLPPFNEQKRIILKIDDMLSLIDSIKASL